MHVVAGDVSMTGTQLVASVHPYLLTWKTRLLVGGKKDSQMINAHLSGQKQHTSSLTSTPHVFSVHAAPCLAQTSQTKREAHRFSHPHSAITRPPAITELSLCLSTQHGRPSARARIRRPSKLRSSQQPARFAVPVTSRREQTASSDGRKKGSNCPRRVRTSDTVRKPYYC